MSANKITDEQINKPFANRLRLLMENEDGQSPLGRKVTQTELSQAFADNGTPVTRQTISLYVNGNTTPDIDKFKFIADFFGVSYDFLLGESDSKKRANIEISKQLGLDDDAIYNLQRLVANINNPKSKNEAIFNLFLLNALIKSSTSYVTAANIYQMCKAKSNFEKWKEDVSKGEIILNEFDEAIKELELKDTIEYNLWQCTKEYGEFATYILRIYYNKFSYSD